MTFQDPIPSCVWYIWVCLAICRLEVKWPFQRWFMTSNARGSKGHELNDLVVDLHDNHIHIHHITSPSNDSSGNVFHPCVYFQLTLPKKMEKEKRWVGKLPPTTCSQIFPTSSWWFQPNLKKYEFNWIISPGRGCKYKTFELPPPILFRLLRTKTTRNSVAFATPRRPNAFFKEMASHFVPHLGKYIGVVGLPS